MALKGQTMRRNEPSAARTRAESRHRSLLSALRDSSTAAMASDAQGRVVFWNQAAERVLSLPAATALGRPCHDLVQARDVFGNRFCTKNCPVVDMARRNEAIRPFEWQVAGLLSETPRKAQVQILRLPGEGPGQYSLLHLLEPIDEDGRLSQVLSALRASPVAATEMSPPSAEPDKTSPAAPPLTPREMDVLACISRGLRNKEIAAELGISVATVRNHVHAILGTLDVHSKLEALSLAVRQGWTHLESGSTAEAARG